MKIPLIALLMLLQESAVAGYPMAELFPAGTQTLRTQNLGITGPGAELLPRLEAAMKDAVLMKEVMARTKPGEPLAYDPRFGMSQAEYEKLMAAMKSPKLTTTGKTTSAELGGDKDYFTVKSNACSFLAGGARVDKITGSLLIPGRDPIKAKDVDNASFGPFAPVKGYQWRFVSESPVAKVELNLLRRVGKDKCWFSCDSLGGTPLVKEELIAEYDCAGGGGSSGGSGSRLSSSTSARSGSGSSSEAKDPVDLLAGLDKGPSSDAAPAPAPSPSAAPAAASAEPMDPLVPACVAGFRPEPETRDIGAQLSHDKNGKMGLHFVAMPKAGGRMIDINRLDFADEYPKKFTISDGGAKRAFVSVDLSPGSRLDKCLDDFAKRIGSSKSEDTLWRFKKFFDAFLRETPDNFRFDWDAPLITWSAAELDKAKHLSPGHPPLKTPYTNTAAPLESYLKARRGGMLEKALLTALLMKRLKFPSRFRVGGDNRGYLYFWIELKDGRILDVFTRQLSNSGPAPGFPGWIKAGELFVFPYQVFMVAPD